MLKPLRPLIRSRLISRLSGQRFYAAGNLRTKNVEAIQWLQHNGTSSPKLVFDREQPLVLSKSFKHIPAITRWFNHTDGSYKLHASYLEPYGQTIVPLELTQPSKFERFEGPLSLLTAHMTTEHSSSIQLYLAQCPLTDLPAELRDDLPTTEFISQVGKGDVYGSSLWMGRPPTRTPLHRDPNPNIFVQLAGKKIIRLMSPLDGKNLYERVGGNKGHEKMRGDDMMTGTVSEKLEQIAWGEGPDSGMWDRVGVVWKAELQSGDGLYIPLGWWHSIRGIEQDGDGVNASVNWWFR